MLTSSATQNLQILLTIQTMSVAVITLMIHQHKVNSLLDFPQDSLVGFPTVQYGNVTEAILTQ